MSNLIEKLRIIAARAPNIDVPIINAAIERIKELEEKLAEYEEDITDWQYSVESQMRRRKEDK
jgi:hypothetical protein